MTSEEFAKKITTTNTFWPTEWATVYLDGCKQLAKDYLALLKTLEKSSSLFATEAVLHRKEIAGLEEELRALREQVKQQKPVEWEEHYFSKEQARDVFGGPLALQAAIPHSGAEVSSCKFNSELWTVRWPKERT